MRTTRGPGPAKAPKGVLGSLQVPSLTPWPHLVQAALSLQGSVQLLLLLHTHLDHFMQELLFGFLSVQATLQGLPQVLQLGLQSTWSVGMGYGVRGSRGWGMYAWGAQVLGRAGRGEGWRGQRGQGGGD
jgi:hypothetical protein